MRLALVALVLALTVTGANAGKASWYAEGRLTANGERFHPDAADPYTCAHRTLPFNTRVRVTDHSTGLSLVCRVNDRGPARWTGKDIDLNRAAAKHLGILVRGWASVTIEVIG